MYLAAEKPNLLLETVSYKTDRDPAWQRFLKGTIYCPGIICIPYINTGHTVRYQYYMHTEHTYRTYCTIDGEKELIFIFFLI
jgi:hypothetical protein